MSNIDGFVGLVRERRLGALGERDTEPINPAPDADVRDVTVLPKHTQLLPPYL